MKEFLLSVVLLMGLMSVNAQEQYKVSGKIDGFPDGTISLMSDEKGNLEKLGTVQSVNGVFEFTGKVESPMAAYITMANQKGSIPFILENANFTLNIGKMGALIQGGTQQDIYNQFGVINADILRKQGKMQEEFRIAEENKDKAKMEALAAQFNQDLAASQAKEKELLQKYANTYVAAYVVASGMQQLEPEALRARYALLGEAAKATVPGMAIAAMLTQQASLGVGNIAPDFTVKTFDGGAVTLKDMKGKLKLISFWASWSNPSRVNNIELLRLYQRYHAKGLEIVSISLDDNRQKWINAAAEDGIMWGSGSELKGQNSEVARTYFVKDLPYTLLLDENNTIIAKNLSSDELRKKVAELLKKK